MMDPTTRGQLKDMFGHAAAAYAASRPGYPQAAVAWLLGNGVHPRLGARAVDVLDLGAGSGALTRLLVPLTRVLVAAEPSRGLLDELLPALPDLPAVQAAAERLPFADSSFDVVTVATAFHWLDHARALPEIARVLRAGGRLSLVWNTRVLDQPWTRELDHLLRSAQPASLQGDWGSDSAHTLDDSAFFEPPEYAEFPLAQPLSRDGLVGLVSSRSYVIALDPHNRDNLLTAVGELFDRSAHNGAVELTYRSECWRSLVR